MKGNLLTTTATGASLGPDNTTVQAHQAASEKKEQTFKNDLQRLQYEELARMIAQRNDLVGRLNAASGDRQTLTEQIRENSTDENIVALREEIAKLILELDELVKPIVEATIAEASGDVNGIEEQIKELDGTLKPGVSYYRHLYGDEAAEFFPKQERVKGATLRSGSGGRRIRGFNVTVTIDGEDTTFENFSTAAKHIGVETVDLQQEFFKRGGSEDLGKIPDEVNFVVNFVEVDDDNNETAKEAFVKAYRTEEAKAKAAAGDSSDSEPANDSAAESSDEADEAVDVDEDDLDSV